MYHFAGLDVSVKETSICIVDDTGRIVRVASEPEALLQVLGNPIYRFKRIGLEAGPVFRFSSVVIILLSLLFAHEMARVCVRVWLDDDLAVAGRNLQRASRLTRQGVIQ